MTRRWALALSALSVLSLAACEESFVDEVGVEQNTDLGGSAFTVGKYLSPRLYLSYGVGLFEPGQVVTLRYRISDRWSLEGSQGPQNQRVGLDFRIEK